MADAEKLTAERGAVYGHPLDDFGRAVRLKEVIAEIEDPVLRHAAEMICVKLARLCATPTHLDSWDDIAGYARTGRMVIEERECRRLAAGGCGIDPNPNPSWRNGDLGTMSFTGAAQLLAHRSSLND